MIMDKYFHRTYGILAALYAVITFFFFWLGLGDVSGSANPYLLDVIFICFVSGWFAMLPVLVLAPKLVYELCVGKVARTPWSWFIEFFYVLAAVLVVLNFFPMSFLAIS